MIRSFRSALSFLLPLSFCVRLHFPCQSGSRGGGAFCRRGPREIPVRGSLLRAFVCIALAAGLCVRAGKGEGVCRFVLAGETDAEDSLSGREADPLSDRNICQVVLVLDLSGSMASSDPDRRCLDAAAKMIEELSAAPEGEKDWEIKAAVVPFSDSLGEIMPLTLLDGEGTASVCGYLRGLSYTSGDTDIGQAMEKAVSLLKENGQGDCPSTIFLMTDGEIDLPKAEDEAAAEEASLKAALLAAEGAKDLGCVIDTAALDIGSRMDVYLPGYLADRTGGRFMKAESPDKLLSVFESVRERVEARLKEAEQERISREESEKAAAMEQAAALEKEQETEKEEEEEPALSVVRTGEVGDTVILGGIIPQAGKAEIDLSGLFSVRLPSSSASAEETGYPDITYRAVSSEEEAVVCSVEGNTLYLQGTGQGSAEITVTASLGDEEGSTAKIDVRTRAVFPSLQMAAAAGAALAAAAAALTVLAFRRKGGQVLEGVLRWYVKTEGQKIFGVPTMQEVHLSEYTSGLRMSELVSDAYAEDAGLEKVVIRRNDHGLRIESHTSACRIREDGQMLVRRLELGDRCRFRILCEGNRGRVAVCAVYEKSPEELPGQEEDRTRLLA